MQNQAVSRINTAKSPTNIYSENSFRYLDLEALHSYAIAANKCISIRKHPSQTNQQ